MPASSRRSSNCARDAERRRHDAAGVARMHALGQHLNRQRAGREATQRRRRPQALVVAAAGIEADHEIDAPDPRRQRVEIGGQIVAAALLAGLDDPDAAGVRRCSAPAARRSRPATRTPRSRRRRRRGRTAGHPPAPASTARVPRASRSSPAACRDGRTAAPWRRRRLAGRRHVEEEHRRAPGQADDLSGRGRAPAGRRTHACASPTTRSMWPFCRQSRVEVRRLRGNADVVDELRDDSRSQWSAMAAARAVVFISDSPVDVRKGNAHDDLS